MEVAKLLVELISAIIWPSTLLILSLLFREQISLILSGKLKAKYKDYEITIENLRQKHIEKDAIVEKIEEEIELRPEPPSAFQVSSIESSLKVYKKILTDEEEYIIGHLKENGGSASRTKIIFDYFEDYDDPWHRAKNSYKVAELIERMVEKELVIREGELVKLPT